ncbi:MAG: PQQ-like beta-propeller repeat protein [Pirellulales bacterium]|nr:PQQ-like beta-propeller repeat protein [Pirellulales bacterium]
MIHLLVVLWGWGPISARAVSDPDNWSRFRGPNGTGQAGDIAFPTTWSESDYLWKVALPGIGHSSPVCWENRVWVTSGDPDTGTVTLTSLVADSGRQRWRKSFISHAASMHASNSYASTTPALDASHVYFTWASAGEIHLAALTHAGVEVWRIVLGQFVGPHGFAASPVVIDGVVCVQCDQQENGFLAGVDAQRGELRWRMERPAGKASYATPCAISTEIEGRPVKAVVVQSMTAGMQAIEVQSGAVVWELPDVFPQRCVSSPLLAGKVLIGVSGGGGRGRTLVGVTLVGGADQPPRQSLSLSKNLPYVPTPIVRDELLFLWQDRGTVACIDLKDGSLIWNERVSGNYFGSPILAGGKLYCMSKSGKVVVLAADREFGMLGENELGDSSSATPAVHGRRMYLRAASFLACLPAQKKMDD